MTGQLPQRDPVAPPMTAYIAVGLTALFFVALGLGLLGGIDSGTSGILLRVGAFLMAAGLLFVAYAVYGRNQPGRMPGIAEDSISFNIARLTVRRDILRTAWLWMLAPLVPGIVLLHAGAAFVPEIGPLWASLAGLVSVAALAVIAVLNARAASVVDAEIAELEKERAPR